MLFGNPINHVGLWVVRDQITSEVKADKVIDFAEENGITDLFVQVRGRGDAFYQSDLVPLATHIRNKNFDPLKYILSRAHPKSIKVHAWINVYLLWSSDEKPSDKKHLLYKHPEWCTVDEDGEEDIKKRVKDFKANNTEGIYLSPMKTAANQWLLNVVKELVNKYNVDGLHLDYIRFPKYTYGYHIDARRKFKAENKVDPILLSISDKSYFSGFEIEEIDRLLKEWNKYRCNSISDFVKNVKTLVVESGKPILVSAAVKPDPLKAKMYFYQDWATWLKKGWLDFAVPMNYSSDAQVFEDICTEISKSVSTSKIWMGIGAYNQNKYDTMAELMISLTNKYNGVVFFSIATFFKHPEHFSTVKSTLNYVK